MYCIVELCRCVRCRSRTKGSLRLILWRLYRRSAEEALRSTDHAVGWWLEHLGVGPARPGTGRGMTGCYCCCYWCLHCHCHCSGSGSGCYYIDCCYYYDCLYEYQQVESDVGPVIDRHAVCFSVAAFEAQLILALVSSREHRRRIVSCQ